jgi:hypothetical protein
MAPGHGIWASPWQTDPCEVGSVSGANSPSLQTEVAEPQINIIRLFCIRKLFQKDDHSSISGSLGSVHFPPPFNICMATVYYTNLTWWVVSTSARKLLLNIVIFISRWAGAHSTRWELCFSMGKKKKYASCNSILKMSPSWAFHVGVWVGF